MSTGIPVPRRWLYELAALQLPHVSDSRLQSLMDRNNDGQLGDEEKEELAALVELGECLSIASSTARFLLDNNP
jgi:hypothetical protein